MQMAMYAAQWERKAATKKRPHVEAEQFRLARVLWLAGEDRQSQERPWQERSILKRLSISPRHARA
jgi:hypothetical protein